MLAFVHVVQASLQILGLLDELVERPQIGRGSSRLAHLSSYKN